MTYDDDVRRALSAYADSTPYLDPRAGLGERLARHARVRRTAAVGISCAALVVTGSGVAALTHDRGTAAVVASGGPTAGAPSGGPTGGAPSGVATPFLGADPSPSNDPDHPPIVGEAGGPGGLRVKATLSPGGGTTSTVTWLDVETRDDDGDPWVSEIAWGDGSTVLTPGHDTICGSGQLPADSEREPDPATWTERHPHAWRHPGRYTVTVTVQSDVVCAQERPPTERQTVRLDVEVTAGQVTSNGPAAAVAVLKWDHVPGHARILDLSDSVFTDSDGWFESVTINWGDGSTPQTIRNQYACEDHDGASYPNQWDFYVPAQHEFPRSGAAYSITILGTSSGCDGKDRDPVIRTAVVRV